MSKIEIFDGLELISTSELDHNRVLIVNYRLTRDMPMGDYSRMVDRLHDHWDLTNYRSIHINVRRGGDKSMESETKQDLDLGTWYGHTIESEYNYSNQQDHINPVEIRNYLKDINRYTSYRLVGSGFVNNTATVVLKRKNFNNGEEPKPFLRELAINVNRFGYDHVNVKLVK